MLGLLDDLVLIPLGVVFVQWMVPARVMDDCRVRADAAFVGGGPVSRTGAVLVVVLWGGLAYLAYRLFAAWA